MRESRTNVRAASSENAYLKMDVVGVAAAAICVALLLAFREGSSGPQTVAADEEEDF